MAITGKALEAGKRGFTGLIGKLGRGSTRTPARAPEDMTLFPDSPMFTGTSTTGVTPLTRMDAAREAYRRSIAKQELKQQERAAAGKLPIPSRILGTAAARPGRTLVGLGALGGLGYATFGDALKGIGREDVSLAGITAPTERERYLTSMQDLINQTYAVDPTQQTQQLAMATAAAERAAMAYEKMGRPDLAEGARQEVMNRYNQAALATQMDLASQRREALGTVQAQALELPSVRIAPSELRDTAQAYANDYYSLSAEDQAYYANLGYGNVTQYVQGKINGEI